MFAKVKKSRLNFPAPMTLDWTDLGFNGVFASVRDMWAGKDLGLINGQFKVTVLEQGGLLLIVRGHEGIFAHYTSATTENDERKASNGSETVFAHLGQVSSPSSQIKIVYTNKARSTKVFGLHVNGETGTHVAFPPTGSASASIWIQAKLHRPSATSSPLVSRRNLEGNVAFYC